MVVSQVKFFLKGKQMNVSQHIEAGALTGSYTGWSGQISLHFGEDRVEFKADETQLRTLAKKLNERIEEIDKERAEEAAKLKEEEVEVE
tara:strand:- start:518 stop:784 length:267 start_codon:yes stop_codon:yes gene_type:complete